MVVQVLVGRNNKQNDELTNRVAKAGDVWMHARGFPGAHVLLRASVTNRSFAQCLLLTCVVKLMTAAVKCCCSALALDSMLACVMHHYCCTLMFMLMLPKETYMDLLSARGSTVLCNE